MHLCISLYYSALPPRPPPRILAILHTTHTHNQHPLSNVEPGSFPAEIQLALPQLPPSVGKNERRKAFECPRFPRKALYCAV